MSEIETTAIEIGGERLEAPVRVPLLPVRNTVVFPGVTLPLSVGRAASMSAVQSAARAGGFLAVVTQRAPETESPRLEDLYPIGTLTKIVHLAETGSGVSVAVVGLARIRLSELHDAGAHTEVDTEVLPDLLDRTPEAEAARRTVQRLGKELVALRDDLPDEAAQILDRFDDPARLADVIAFNGTMPLPEKIELLAQQDVLARLRTLMRYLMREIRIAQVSKTFAERAAGEIGEDERRKLLREQLRKIRAELGENDEQGTEGDELRDRLEKAALTSEALEVAEREVGRLAGMPTHSPERSVVRTYVEWLLDLPWKAQTDDNLDLAHARRILDEDHFDLEKVKERILEYLAVRRLVSDPKGPILCFLGPPGVGKTSLGKSIARAMGRKFVRASLGGVRDEAEIRGHRRTYVGALPGRILQSLKTAGTRNPVFILDEIDKVGMDYRGDPSSALLEVLDPEQNFSFSDHYVEVPFDLSKVLFVATANRTDTIPAPLLDRMEIIELPGYTATEKLRIGRDHLLPRQLTAHGLTAESLALSDEVLLRLVEGYTREAGVRSLERNIASLVRKAALRIAEGGKPSALAVEDLAKLLGPAPFSQESAERTQRPGVATGMVWTPVGGDLVFVESARMEGKPELHLTGQMGDVMRESAEAALSYVRTNAESLGIAPDTFEKSRIHVHVPAGGQPKDGPSAGVTMVVSLTSLLTGKPVRDDVAMTGEITLRGQVLPVGGIKGKVLAAHRAGIKELILPKRNAKDLEEVPAEVLACFKIHLVDQSIEAVREAIPGIG